MLMDTVALASYYYGMLTWIVGSLCCSVRHSVNCFFVVEKTTVRSDTSTYSTVPEVLELYRYR